MTRQEIFDRIWDHFITQRRPRSVDPETNQCQYRGPDGAMCAVGLVITDEEYHKDFENLTVRELRICSDDGPLTPRLQTYSRAKRVREALKDPKYDRLRLLLETHEDFLGQLQRVHDGDPDHDNIHVSEKALRRVAEAHGLRVPTP